jgi:hypothetical protein
MMQKQHGRVLILALGVGTTFWMMAGAPPVPGGQGLPQPKKEAAPVKPAAQKAASKTVEAPADTSAAALFYLDGMVKALGGAERLASVRTMRMEWMAYFNMFDQSERPEGPHLMRLMQATEERDVKKDRFRIALQARSFMEPRWSDAIIIGNGNALAAIAGEQQVPASPNVWQDFHEPILFSPERLAATARDGKNLTAEASVQVAGSTLIPLSFTTAGGLPARILINKDTMLPSAVEWISTRLTDSQWYPFGDLRTRMRFSVWSQDLGGIPYPRQWDVERNGKFYSGFSITSLVFNAPLDDAQLMVDPTVERVFQATTAMTMDNIELGVPNNPATTVDQRVLQIPGRLGVTLVRQDDGVMVIDAPLSNGYTKKVMEEVAWRYKGQPLKGVVSTSDSWVGNGGLREYVAASVPIYLAAINKPFVEELLASAHTLRPDTLAARPKHILENLVAQRSTVGTAGGRMDLIPMKTSAGERVMLIYFPESKLLYTSTMVTQMTDKSFAMPAYLGEVISVVQREKLDVTTVFGSLLKPTPYSEMVQFYNRVANAPLPPGN